MSSDSFANVTLGGEIPSYNGTAKEKATDFANYFCSYAQLYHQKQMLTDHNRMAAYHSAIIGNANIFKDKIVMDVGTGSGILAVWAAQAGAKRVYAVEYTDMAKHARRVIEANGVSHIVTVIQGEVESIELPAEDFPLEEDAEEEVDDDDDEGNDGEETKRKEDGESMDTSKEEDGDKKKEKKKKDEDEDAAEASKLKLGKKRRVVDIIVSEWMGYFLLRESMLDSLIIARERFLRKRTGLLFPSHATMYWAPVVDEEERRQGVQEYNAAMGDWYEFAETTRGVYGVDMTCLEKDFDREQKEYYQWSSRWAELSPSALLAEPAVVKQLDLATCSFADARGIAGETAPFDFEIVSGQVAGPVSGFAGWFTVDFSSRTDDDAAPDEAPVVSNPVLLSTGPENGYTHWGQQVFHLPSSIPIINGETTRLQGTLEMSRTKESARLYNCRIRYTTSRRKNGVGTLIMASRPVEHVFQMP